MAMHPAAHWLFKVTELRRVLIESASTAPALAASEKNS
jgi:hypothetical protein